LCDLIALLKWHEQLDEAANVVFVQLIEQEPGIYMTNVAQTMLGRTKWIWLGKEFLMR
jgi:hypothetical protein